MAIWYGNKLGIPGYFMGALTGFLGFFGVALTIYKTCVFIKKFRIKRKVKQLNHK